MGKKMLAYFISLVFLGFLYIAFTASILQDDMSSTSNNAMSLSSHKSLDISDGHPVGKNSFLSEPHILNLVSHPQDNKASGQLNADIKMEQLNVLIEQIKTKDLNHRDVSPYNPKHQHPYTERKIGANHADTIGELVDKEYGQVGSKMKPDDSIPNSAQSKHSSLDVHNDTHETENNIIKDKPHDQVNKVKYRDNKVIDQIQYQDDKVKTQSIAKSELSHQTNYNVPVKYDSDVRKKEVPQVGETRNSRPENSSQKSTKMVLILTEGRSGSTWLMEVLSYPKNIMVFFEPLNTKVSVRFEATRREQESELEYMSRWRREKIAQICNCHLQDYTLGSVNGWQRNYRNFSRSHDMKSVVKDCHEHYNRTVAKTIRLYDITDLKLLEETGCTNYKIIHLIRDPRPVLLSRMETFKELYDGNRVKGPYIQGGLDKFDNDYVSRAAHDLCNNHMHNINHSTDGWLAGRYKRVLYEDFATEPVRIADELYHFIDQPFTRTDMDYVYQTSHDTKGGGGYETIKNSTLVLNQWKKKILSIHLDIIERECRDLMVTLGYKFGLI